MVARGGRRGRIEKHWLMGALLLGAATVSHAEPGPALPLLGEGEALPDFRSDLIYAPRYRDTNAARPVNVSAPDTSKRGVRFGYDRLFDEQQLRTPPPIHERMRANMRDPQPTTVLKLPLR